MGWLFGDKKPEIDLIRQNKQFTEDTLCWLAENLDGDAPLSRGQLLPELHDFPFTDLSDDDQLMGLARKVCEYMNMPAENILLNLFDEDTKAYRHLGNTGNISGEVFMDQRWVPYPAVFTGMLAVELARLKLEEFFTDDKLLDDYSEIAAVYYGFGLFVLNCYTEPWNRSRSALPVFLSQDINVYALALLHHAGKKEVAYLENYMDREAYGQLDRYLRALKASDEGRDFSTHWENALKRFPFNKVAFSRESRPEDKVEAYSKLLEIDPVNVTYFSNRGYSYLSLREYEKAIADFDKAIEKDPFWSFPFTSRGFAYLNMGQLERGKHDTDIAFRLDGDNGYALRNSGYYYYLKGDYDKAIEMYIEAQDVQDNIDHIHYFTGLAWLKLGQKEKAREEFELSKQIPELPAPDYPEL